MSGTALRQVSANSSTEFRLARLGGERYRHRVFESFTERARHVVVLAQDESRSFAHGYIGAEHLLLGLLREETGVAARALESLRLTLADVRQAVAQSVPPGNAEPSGQIPFTPEAKHVLEQALRESRALHHTHVGTEHILLALTTDEEGLATRILREHGTGTELIRSTVNRMLASSAQPDEMRPAPRAGVRVPVWEYRLERAPSVGNISVDHLNVIGAEGWELTGVIPNPDETVLLFKRARRP